MASSPLRLFSTSGRKEKIQRESFWFRESEELKKKNLIYDYGGSSVHHLNTRELSSGGKKAEEGLCKGD